eukprot:10991804-Prorocentrum_lima.AAC.1
MADASERLKKTFEAIQELKMAGLSKHWAGALLKQYAGAASQYVLRLGAATVEEAQMYDKVLRQSWEQLLGRSIHELSWKCMCLPQRMGGFGVQSAE